MGSGLGELGFWLAVGMVVAAVIVAGAIKERERQAALRDSQAALRESQERRQAMLTSLLEKGGDHMPEVLAYLRERDAAAATRAESMMRRNDAMLLKNKAGERQGLAFVGAFMVGAFSFIGGLIAAGTQSHPAFPRLEFSAQAGRVVPVSPPVPTGWAALLPVGVMLGIWAAGLIIAGLIVMWGGFGTQKNDARTDA